MIGAYRRLHELGYGHSIEAWRDDELVGGLYGLALGKVFFGESMFAHRADASKAALVGLVDVLRGLDVPLVDCQQETQHLASFGARPIPRRQFVRLLDPLIAGQGPPRAWPRGEIASTA
jgi:leucyl/phenylalanyl-tRNA--protein transferase